MPDFFFSDVMFAAPIHATATTGLKPLKVHLLKFLLLPTQLPRMRRMVEKYLQCFNLL
jgi:hypothetical protein